MPHAVTPFALKDAPALIERLLPVQKLSAESYKEQMAGNGKTLTALGSYWKGRKPLILAKACVLGCLLPATDNPQRDLEVFEQLMAMDAESFVVRWKQRFSLKQVLASLNLPNLEDYVEATPPQGLPPSAPVDWSQPQYAKTQVSWRADRSELDRRRLLAQMLPSAPYRTWVEAALRPEEVMERVHDHIWPGVNQHLGTQAQCLPELVEQLGIMRFGHRPRVADSFCGSGQIPFEAARLGCDVYASDLNPVACMLTWGAFQIVGGSAPSRATLTAAQQALVAKVQGEIDRLGVETDGQGWRAKVFLYCVEVRCPQTGWQVPLIPSLVVSTTRQLVAQLVPDPTGQRYQINIVKAARAADLAMAKQGTVRTEGRGQDPYMVHVVEGVEYRTKISTLRGDYRQPSHDSETKTVKGQKSLTGNRLRLWEKHDFKPRPEDIFQERLYCIQWMRPKPQGKGDEYEFRAVTPADLEREARVEGFIADHLADWQQQGWLPDMRIEPGVETDRLYRERGWTYWHHLFNPRQLLLAGLFNQFSDAPLKFGVSRALNQNARLSRWDSAKGSDKVQGIFDNQALNTLFNYGTRGSSFAGDLILANFKHFPLPQQETTIAAHPAHQIDQPNDIFITDPPYGDAVKYEEILDFFIAWLRKNPPPEFADWVWDSRRSLAIQGQDETFRRNMVAAYGRMTACMADNGLQVIMFTHNAGSIWADMANIVWASGLQVSAAWYVATETDSALREGSHVKGTVLLVCRKRQGNHKTTRDDLAWDLQEEVEQQVATLTGLNQQAKGLYRDQNLFEDADIQMAGYAAALRVLTRYATIDGRAMVDEAIRPRVKGETTFVDDLISFAVATANQCLVPQGIAKALWNSLTKAERFYLKMIDLEARGQGKLDNYQNFAKAFKVRDYTALMASQRANDARLKTPLEFGRSELGETSQLYQSVLRAVLYAIMELVAEVESDSVIAHLALMVPNYYYDLNQCHRASQLADYLAKHLERRHPPQASAARVLSELIKNQRLG